MTAKLGLGTVQFGMNYGIMNDAGQTNEDEVRSILSHARASGVETLDTATAYGNSEECLGHCGGSDFRIVTKTPHLQSIASLDARIDSVKQAFAQSLQNLRTDAVHGLLMHSADDLLTADGEKIWDVLQTFRTRGLVEKIGVSVYDGAQIDAVQARFDIDLIQLPINVLDQRLIAGGQLTRLKKANVEIHARSAFLQGLLLMPLSDIPAYFTPILPTLKKWHTAVAAAGTSLTQAALAFVRDLPEIDVVIMGVNNQQQFLMSLADFQDSRPFSGQGLACNSPDFVNPAQWILP